MKFEAKKISSSFDLELVTITGENVILKPKDIMTSRKCIDMTNAWKAIESTNGELGIKDRQSSIEIGAKELSLVYSKTADWFIDNFDPETLHDILMYVANLVAGVRKN